MELEDKLFKIAYKKLKSSLYYDKTQTILRDKLVYFEAEQKNIDNYWQERNCLRKFFQAFLIMHFLKAWLQKSQI